MYLSSQGAKGNFTFQSPSSGLQVDMQTVKATGHFYSFVDVKHVEIREK